MNANQGPQLGDFVGMVKRRLWMMVAVAGVVFLASVVVAALLPNRYEAWTTLLISPQTVSKKLVEPGVEESDLNNRLHLMTMQILSRGRLSKVIDDLKLYQDESDEMTREEIIELMRNDIRIEPVLPEMEQLEATRPRLEELEINTFRLYYTSHSADTSAAVASRLASDFIDEHIRDRVETSAGTSEFIEAELERLSTAIREVEGQIASVKNDNIGKLPEDLDANQRLVERALTDLRVAQRDLDVAESDAAFYRQQAVTGASDRYRGYSEPDTPAERKQRVELQLNEARSRGLTDKHPDIIAMREELASLEKSLKERNEDEEHRANPDQALAANEAKRAELRAQSARQEVARLRTQVEEVEQRLAQTPHVTELLASLERQHKHLSDSYQEFSNKRLEAGVSANMERRQKGEQFRVLETAFPPPNPTSPNRPLILALGLLLGLAAGAGTALLLEAADSSMHGAREAQTTLGVPVLAAIPKVKLEWDRARERRRRLVAVGLGLGLAAVTLVGAGAGYWIVNGPAARAEQGAQPPGAGDAAAQPARPRG